MILVHTTRFYHTGESTIQATNELVEQALSSQTPVVALAAKALGTDALWYSYRDPQLVTEIRSLGGGHPLYFPSTAETLEITLAGGYHNACLGRALSEILARFVQQSQASRLKIILPTGAIYTGFQFSENGALIPPTPEKEAKADHSVDGLNLFEVTRSMSNPRWADFITESLKWAIFKRRPFVQTELASVAFELKRDGQFIKRFGWDKESDSMSESPAVSGKVVVLEYVSR